MRNKQLRKIVGLFVFLCSFTIRAQLSNGSFETNCGTNGYVVSGCSSFAAGCIQKWFTTHGTPQLSIGSAFDGNAAVLMWAAQGQGEGIGLNIDTPLIEGHEYSICFAYRVNNPEGLAANMRVRLTSGLTHVAAAGCGAANPAGTFQEVGFINISSTTAGWVIANVTFVANDNYDQMIVFPFSVAVQAQNPATVLVDDFRLTGQCTNLIKIDQTSPSVTESYHQVGIIRAGSHVNGSTTTAYVTVDQPGEVVFAAAQYVTLEENFLAIPGANDESFVAMIEGCSSDCRILLPPQRNALVPFPANTDWENMEYGTIDVFPNPASDQITVSSKHGLKSATLSDISGRTIMVFQPSMDENKQTFKLLNIKGGIYLLTLIDNSGKTETKKLIIE